MKLQQVFSEVMSGGGRAIEVESTTGVWRVAVGETVVRFSESEDGEQMLAWAAIGVLPDEPEARETLTAHLLEKSFLGLESGGAVFSAQDGEIYVHKFARLEDITAETLPEFIDAMMDAVDDLVEDIKDIEVRQEADHDEIG